MRQLVYISLLLIAFASSHLFATREPTRQYVTANLIGQLGNQFFQIAAATSLALDNNATAVFPELVNNNDFNIPINYKHVFSKINAAPNFLIAFLFCEPAFTYCPITYKPNMCIQGWFQSEKYFKHNKEAILKLFAPSAEISKYLETAYSEIIANPNTVSIHFRSYEVEDPQQFTHPTLKKQYFLRAISMFPEHYTFIVFSNKIEWCKKAFRDIDRTFIYIENEPHYHDLYLMSMCKHNIIANSSFSWWGAYLNRNPDKVVVAPKKWFSDTSGTNYRDVVPSDWIIVE